MKSWLRSFNIYLLAAGAVLGGGCGSNRLSPNKEYATLSIFMEGRPADSLPVQVGREQDHDVYRAASRCSRKMISAKAKLVDNPDGTYAIQLTFNDHGKLVLEMQTTSNQGKHLVIFANFRPRVGRNRGGRRPRRGKAPAGAAPHVRLAGRAVDPPKRPLQRLAPVQPGRFPRGGGADCAGIE